MENTNKQIASALVKAQRAFGPALKSSTNPHFRSRYADLSACVEAVIEGLNENGIALIQQTHDAPGGVSVETIFLHESGESLSAGRFSLPASKQDAQGYGSALTYARRYSLMAACGIAPEDDDGNAATASVKAYKSKVDVPVKVTKEEPKSKVDADEPDQPWGWWTKAVEDAVTPQIADMVNAFLEAKGQINEGQSWKDLQDKDWQDRINANPSRFVQAATK